MLFSSLFLFEKIFLDTYTPMGIIYGYTPMGMKGGQND